MTVSTAPPTLACSTTAGSGTVAKADVTDVAVACSARSYSSVSADTGGGSTVSSKVAVGPDGTIYFVTWSNVTAGGSGGLYALAPGATTATQLHAFAGGTADGANPSGLTLSPDGTTLYGATAAGGAHGDGTLYSYKIADGTYTILHNFSGSDGSTPYVAPEFASSTMLYGIATKGGSGASPGNGVLYTYDLSSNTYTTLYKFAGGTTDGYQPFGAPVFSNGVYYGALNLGGTNGDGAIYKITMSGGTPTETILHDFGATLTGGAPDGIGIYGVTLGADGKIYGATNTGGTHSDGLVFSMNTDGTGYTILHNFAGGTTDGVKGWGGVALGTDGNIYGQTVTGGTYDQGTLWSITPSGTFTLLHSFGGTGDGINPTNTSLLMLPDGRIYGGTPEGGAGASNGDGTIWSYQ